MYTKCIPHFDKLCIHFVYKIKRIAAAKFCIQKYGTNVCRNMGYILHTFCPYFVYTNSNLQKDLHPKNYGYIQFVYKIHTEFIQIIVCKKLSYVSRYFEPFVLQFLSNHCTEFKLETCWFSTCR